jgi:hypothetical protein
VRLLPPKSMPTTMRLPVVLAAGSVADPPLTLPPLPYACWPATKAGADAVVLLRKLPALAATPLSASEMTWLGLAFAVVKLTVNPVGSIETKDATFCTTRVLLNA